MLKWFDRTLCVLLVLLSAAHGVLGSLMSLPLGDPDTVWHFSGSIAMWLIALLHWLRAARPHDRPLWLWAMVGSLTWIVIMTWFMEVADWWRDPRPWSFVVVCALLTLSAAFQMAVRRSPASPQVV